MKLFAILRESEIEWTNDVLSDDSLTIDIARDTDTNTVVRTLSGEITVGGQAFNDIYNEFYKDAAAGCGTVIPIRVQLECCRNRMYMLELRADGVRVNLDECTAEITLRSVTQNQTAFDCLRSQPFWYSRDGANVDVADNAPTDFILEYPPTRVRYSRNAKDAYFALTMTFIGMAISLFISAGSSALSVPPDVGEIIAQAALGGAFLLAIPILILIAKFRKRYHFAYNFYEIFKYNCERCGLRFESTVLETEYRAAYFIPMTNTQGAKRNDGKAFIEANAPNLNAIELLQQIQNVFNADYQIADGTLFFDRNVRPNGTILDISDATPSPTYQFDFSDYPKVRSIEYTLDAIDDEANNVKHLFETVQDIDGDCRTGVDRVVLPFSVPRSERDGFEDLADLDEIAAETRNELLTRNREAGGGEPDNDISQPRYNVSSDRNFMIVTKDTASQFKLVMLDAVGENEAEIQLTALENGVVVSNYQFLGRVLYERFYSQTDGQLPIVVGDATIYPDDFCAVVSVIERETLNVRFETPYGFASPENITIDFAEQSVTLSQNVLYGN